MKYFHFYFHLKKYFFALNFKFVASMFCNSEPGQNRTHHKSWRARCLKTGRRREWSWNQSGYTTHTVCSGCTVNWERNTGNQSRYTTHTVCSGCTGNWNRNTGNQSGYTTHIVCPGFTGNWERNTGNQSGYTTHTVCSGFTGNWKRNTGNTALLKVSLRC